MVPPGWLSRLFQCEYVPAAQKTGRGAAEALLRPVPARTSKSGAAARLRHVAGGEELRIESVKRLAVSAGESKLSGRRLLYRGRYSRQVITVQEERARELCGAFVVCAAEAG
jgi:hypothetical protein